VDFGRGGFDSPMKIGGRCCNRTGVRKKTMDTIRDQIIRRAKKLNMRAIDVARECVDADGGTVPDVGTVRRYFAGIVSLNSRYVSQICDVLGLELRVKRK
jgi:hypothetical protein